MAVHVPDEGYADRKLSEQDDEIDALKSKLAAVEAERDALLKSASEHLTTDAGWLAQVNALEAQVAHYKMPYHNAEFDQMIRDCEQKDKRIDQLEARLAEAVGAIRIVSALLVMATDDKHVGEAQDVCRAFLSAQGESKPAGGAAKECSSQSGRHVWSAADPTYCVTCGAKEGERDDDE